MNEETRTCQSCKNTFIIDAQDFAFYEKMKVPPPTWCPECRMVRRMVWRNEQSLYRRKDALGSEVISVFAQEKPYTIYGQKTWWSDSWDSLAFGRQYEFSRPFFKQWKELTQRVPLMAVQNFEAVNSDYCSNASRNKNCYCISAAFTNENVLYGNRVLFCRDSVDLHLTEKLELCYENVDTIQSFRLYFSRDSENCSDSYFLSGCRNCSHCFGCINLHNRSYYIFNKSYSETEWKRKVSEFNMGSYAAVKSTAQTFGQWRLQFPNRFAKIINSQNVLGDNIHGSKNCQFCFNVYTGTEDCKFIEWAGYGLKDAYDIEGSGDNTSFLYENVMTERVYRSYFVTTVNDSHDVQYSLYCFSSHALFGCVGIRNKSYCILNKQYTKEEYEVLVPKIIRHMNEMPYVDQKGRIYRYGEFFPPELSPWAYNETIAQEYFPLTKEKAGECGYAWRDPDPRNYQVTMTTDSIPDHVKDVPDSITKEIIQCAHQGICQDQCTTAFKIIPQELQFYRTMNLPLPRLCPNCRHYQRIKQRNPLKLWHRQCQCTGAHSADTIYTNQTVHPHGTVLCPNEFETSYAPDRPEIVYCEECYNAEVV